MSYSPAAVANFFLGKAAQENKSLTPMQLIKLVYIAHGWHLGYFNRPLINERVQAWKFGPVIDSLYHKLKCYGDGPITAIIPMRLGAESPVIDDPNTVSLLDSVFKSYAPYSGLQLSTLTHQADTPWYKAYIERGGRFGWGTEIPEEEIKAHYDQKIAANRVQ
ncbi:type II toxin-antitoxin system antitoxin SocA domain-containing protein [Pseudoxanthomonas sp. CF125]|uniref:Panacea domain-containing protein n=1 Tax=Pseudoxanthomonas sp. CF125 TaxID=1855303 RepID=UPI000882FAAF|nr:type II toxin-antitoxin system antitoxin SocA domain-containing protein [Pseudoxanthomonas sp. CF125]SDR06678.1 Uncharacterized phage-associated protein [Pseudoxanthomonas sp. CF125]